MKKRISSIQVHGKIAFVLLRNGRRAMIDAADVPLVDGHYWTAADNSSGKVKVSTKVNGKVVYLHRLVCEARDGIDQSKNVYHVDGNGLNNRRSNLIVPIMLEKSQKEKIYWGLT